VQTLGLSFKVKYEEWGVDFKKKLIFYWLHVSETALRETTKTKSHLVEKRLRKRL
jgi:hypothetical protein